MYQRVGKRLLDVSLAFAGLVVSAPLWVLILPVMTVVNRQNPFFVQSRPGRFGRVFRLIKVRTMTSQCDSDGVLLPDTERLTALGNWLRRTSLDELPQLLNVLADDMSLVGPRPLLVDYWPLYSPAQHRRHEVPAGITGWAQVNGRNALSWNEKFTLDNWYVDNQSFALDLKILWLTLLTVAGSSRNAVEETALIPHFTGSTPT